MISALDGLRVLDISEGLAAPFAAKLLGDLGADVIKLEPPGGDDARLRADNPEASPRFLFANTSKRSVHDDGELWNTLLAGADVVISHRTEAYLASRGAGFDALRAVNPSVILTTVTGFGSTGPYAEWRWNHLTCCAMGGFAHLCGRMGREPLQVGGSITETLTGAYAAVATLVAVQGQSVYGHGDHVDVSALEATVNAALLLPQRYDYSGDLGERRADIGPAPSFILPTADGYVGANVLTQAQWELMCQFFGREELIDDPLFAGPWDRMANSRELAGELAAQTRERTSADVFHEAQTWRIPFGLIPNLREVLDLLPHREREYFLDIEHPQAGRVRMPGIPFLFDDERPSGTRPPLLGEHSDEVRQAGDSIWPPRQRTPVADGTLPARPLEGLRVIDLSMFMSGPMTTLVFADAGADVIKVESVQRIDGWRASGVSDDFWWEWAPQFNWVNRNKHGITLNLTDPRGADVIRHMVRDADIVVENYTPRVMSNFELDYERLRAINPELIMISMPGFGLTGTWSHYTAFANTTEQMSGLPHLTGYADDQPIFSGTTGGDPLAGVMGALALLAALERRRRLNQQGKPGGCQIDLSQTETATLYLGDAITAYTLSGDDPGRAGNYHAGVAPHNTYRCRDDRWIAIACETDEQFARLARLIGRPDWLSAYASFPERDAARATLDATIAAWTVERDARSLMRELQALGITAAAVQHGLDLLQDPHLAERGFFVSQQHRYAGLKRYPMQPYHFREWAEPRTDRPAPTLGEHSRAVLSRLTELSDDEIDQLATDDVIGTIPLAARAD